MPANAMDFSLPFRRDSTFSAQEQPASESNAQSNPLLGEYIGIAIKSGIRRSFMGDSERKKPLAEGTAFRAFRSSIREYDKDQNMTSTPVAIKMLRGSPYGTDPLLYPHKEEFRKKQLEALLREMRVLCDPTLRGHENIVRLLEWGFSTLRPTMEDVEDPEWQTYQPYIVLEYAEHRTLQLFQHNENCSSVARNLALDVASALETLHACGIAHGDLKLENILVFPHPQRGYRAKLSDFSHSINSETNSQYLGTERYRPPELSDHARGEPYPLDSLLRFDIWNFGTAIFELLSTSEFEYTTHNSDWSVDAVLNHNSLQHALSKTFEHEKDIWKDVLASSLHADPADRKSMQQLRSVLDVENRCRAPVSEERYLLKFPTVLEVIAGYSLCDEKYHLQHRLAQTSVYGPISERSYHYFQLAQAHFNGFGFNVDISKALFAYIFSAKEPDEPSDPTAISLAPRIIGAPLEGHGPHSAIVSLATADLSEGPEETYYARRIRKYRLLSVQMLKSSPLIADVDPELPFAELATRIQNNRVPSVVTTRSNLLDLEIQPELPLAHFLCLVGDLELIKHLREGQDGALDLQALDHSGNSCLHYACMGGHAQVAGYLINEKGLAINTANADGSTPLHWLPFFAPEDIHRMAELLSHPNNLDATTKGCRIPLHLLYLRGTPLQWSVSCRNRGAVLALLDLGANVNVEYDGYTALAGAVELHTFEVVDLLLGSGARIHGIGLHGRSALHYVAGNAPIIRRQCIHGSKGCEAAVMKTIQALERHSCDINARDRHDNTPLHKAVASPIERGDLYIIKALLLSGANRNAQNIDGDTVLHLAIKLAWVDRPCHINLLQMLADDELAFSDVSLKTTLRDKDGRTPHLVGALLNVTSDVTKFIPMAREDILGHDNEGNYFMSLANKGVREIFHYTQVFKQRLRNIGLAVTLQPDCT